MKRKNFSAITKAPNAPYPVGQSLDTTKDIAGIGITIDNGTCFIPIDGTEFLELHLSGPYYIEPTAYENVLIIRIKEK